LLSAWLLNGFANGLPAGLFLLFVTYRIEAPERAGLLLLLYFGAGLAGIPLWLAASRRFGKHRAWICAMVASCAFFAAVPFLGAGDVIAFAAICVLTGACLGADLALPPSMQADVVDIDAREMGRRRTGLYFGLWNIATKLALALAIGIAFPLLELAGFATGGGANGAWALAALSGLYGVAPIACKLAAVALMLRYGVAIACHAMPPGPTERTFDASTPVSDFRFGASDSRV
ncbi:MAG: MFS transporter, partial [Alphaproteobacteria bacterium]